MADDHLEIQTGIPLLTYTNTHTSTVDIRVWAERYVKQNVILSPAVKLQENNRTQTPTQNQKSVLNLKINLNQFASSIWKGKASQPVIAGSRNTDWLLRERVEFWERLDRRPDIASQSKEMPEHENSRKQNQANNRKGSSLWQDMS